MKPSEFIKEEFDSKEYNDEAGMVENNLVTIMRSLVDLANHIKHDDNLPEWCQEKIAAVKGMMVSVSDYIVSQKSLGIDPKVDQVSEDASGGGTSSGGIATTPMGGMAKRSQVGSLFGGTYQQPKKSKAKKK